MVVAWLKWACMLPDRKPFIKTAFPMMVPLYETRRENLFKRLVKALIYQSDQGLHSSFACFSFVLQRPNK